MRHSAALAGSLLLNLLLLAGVVAAMRGPDLLAPGGRSALVTVSIMPEPRQMAAPPPPASPSQPAGREIAAAPLPVAGKNPALAQLTDRDPGPASTPAPSSPPPAAIPPAPVGTSPPAPVSLAAAASAAETYRQHVWQCILAARPRAARGSGTVTIRFRIDHHGALVSAAVTGSSGQFMLDRLALQAVRKAAPFPAPPAGMDETALTFTVPVAFHH